MQITAGQGLGTNRMSLPLYPTDMKLIVPQLSTTEDTSAAERNWL